MSEAWDSYQKARPTEIRSEFTQCADPSCSGVAEPEQDGEHLYFQCQECGMEFGWSKVPNPTSDPTCQLGLPEDVRRMASALNEKVDVPSGPTPVQITRKPR